MKQEITALILLKDCPKMNRKKRQRKKTVITITVSQSMLKRNPFSFQERQDGDAGWNFRLISKTVKSSVELQ